MSCSRHSVHEPSTSRKTRENHTSPRLRLEMLPRVRSSPCLRLKAGKLSFYLPV